MPILGTDALIKVDLTTTFGGTEMHNIFWYHTPSAASPIYANWHAQFSSTIVGPLNALQAAAVDMPNMSVVNVNSTDVPYEADPGFGAGVLLGETFPPFIAAAVKLVRSTTETRNGHKRVYVGTETEQNGGLWTPAFKTSLDAWAALLDDILVVDTVSWTPVIVRQYTLAPNPTLLPVDQWTYNPVGGVVVSAKLRHQVSRE